MQSEVAGRFTVANDGAGGLSEAEREIEWGQQYRDLEDRLNESYDEFINSDRESYRFVEELKLRTHIFCYEIWTDVATFGRNNPRGFARIVAFKSILHKLVEFAQGVDSHLRPAVLEYAARQGKNFTDTDWNELRSRWRPTFKRIVEWRKIRNKATGHYDPDTAEVVSKISSIDV
ncbi:hypothetical protein WT22_06400 [Burkholderia territorii]|uniref:hypothetical protein n=1 Tax=Burkholderia territorii TaxID=1503055 RepID=UPI0007572E65|nr:hypothetical protein [Burkholderia territorii]KVQ67918.1 hypothetical protein WT22_06400 [Burkholderia territorii]